MIVMIKALLQALLLGYSFRKFVRSQTIVLIAEVGQIQDAQPTRLTPLFSRQRYNP